MKFSLTISRQQVDKTRHHVVADYVKKTAIKGFRKGKAPANLVEAKVGEKAIIEGILDHVLPQAYADHVHKNNLKPLSMPKISPKQIKPGEDWLFNVEIAQKPEVKLGKYKQYIKSTLTKLKTKKPSKSEPRPKPDEDPQLVAIFDALLQNSICEVPELLIEEETNNQLGRLASQLQKLGLTVEKYLDSIKTSSEQLQKNYRQSAASNLKLEFILDALITDLKIKIEESEIDALIASMGDDEVKTRLQTPREREGIRHTLAKRQVVEKLKQL